MQYAIIDPEIRALLEYPVSNIRKKFPNVSLPRDMSVGKLPANIVKVYVDPKPETGLLQKAVQNQPAYVAATKKWVSTWTVLDKTEQEINDSFTQVYDQVKSKVGEMLNEFAKEKGYDGIVSLCSYSNSTNTTFATEANIGIQKRDQTWDALYAFYDGVVAGTTPLPNTEAEILAILPDLVW